MSSFRVCLSQRQRKLLFSLLTARMNLNQVSISTGLNFSSLRHWQKGQRTMSSNAVEILEAKFPETRKIFSKATKLEDVFWASKGGRSYASRRNKRQHSANMSRVRSFKKQYPPISFKPEENPMAMEFFGIMMGDGCVTEYYSKSDGCARSAIFISGNAFSDEDYLKHRVSSLLMSAFKTHAYLRSRKTSRTIDLVIRNRQLVNWLKSNGFPSGKKGQIKIPARLFSLPFDKLKYLIRGLFDTDGCLSARKSENYRDPFILISSSSIPLRNQLKRLLREHGYPAYDSSNMVGIKGAKHVRRWFEEIGSSNQRNTSRYESWLKTGVLPPK